ncbi:MAG: hypothetical protein AAB393_18095, partial [Bacteroidota bacterium]
MYTDSFPMPNPLELELRFQTLKPTLALLAGRRMKLLRIAEFLEPLLADTTFLSAYAAELLPQLASLIINTRFAGTSLGFLDRLSSLLGNLQSSLPPSSAQGNLQQAVSHLESERRQILQWLKEREIGSPSAHQPKTEAVWIPLVEREHLLSGVEPRFATLQQLRVEVRFASKPTDEDELHVEQFAATDGADRKHLKNALEAAKHLLKTFARIEVKQRLIVHCSFAEQGMVVGESLEAGLAAALFTELLRLYQYREEYTLRNDVAITGRIDEHGNLLPVDEAGFRLKIEACSYSWIKYLIVPQGQQGSSPKQNNVTLSDVPTVSQVGTESKGDTGTDTPAHVEVVPIPSLADLFYNRRLTDSWRVPRTKQVARKLWKHHRPIAATVFVLLLLVIGKMWYGPIDKEPVGLEFEGRVMRAVNKHGGIIQEIEVGERTVDAAQNRRVAELFDTDNDGHLEVIWGRPTSYTPTETGTVFCQTVGENSLSWKYELYRELNFPNRQEAADHRFDFRRLLVG